MNFSPEEISKIKAMLLYLVKKKHNESGGHCGFSLFEIRPILQEMATKGEVISRPTIHENKYFINPKKL